MKFVVFSDVHSNYYALSTFCEYLHQNVPEDVHIFFLGDFIGYLNFDVRVIELLEQLHQNRNVTMLLGNHDAALFNHLNITSLSISAAVSIEETIQNNLPFKDSILRLFPLFKTEEIEIKHEQSTYILSHAGISDIYNHYYYPDLRFIELYGQSFKPSITYIFGHTHRGFIVNSSDNTFVNVGSLGLPRDGDPRLSFLEVDDNEMRIQRLFYPIDKAYSFNAQVDIRNALYFGGKSTYSSALLLDLNEPTDILRTHFSIYTIYKKAIYIENNNFLYQIYKIQFKDNLLYLLRFQGTEAIYESFKETLKGVSDDANKRFSDRD